MWRICCTLTLALQLTGLPCSTGAADVRQPGTVLPASPSPVDLSSADLLVDQKAGRETVFPGENIPFETSIANTTPRTAALAVRLLNVLPPGLRLVRGSIRINGASAPDPAVSADGRALTFPIGDIPPGGSSTLRFEIAVAAECPRTKAFSIASAISGAGNRSNISRTAITISEPERPAVESAVPAVAAASAARPVPPPAPAPEKPAEKAPEKPVAEPAAPAAVQAPAKTQQKETATASPAEQLSQPAPPSPPPVPAAQAAPEETAPAAVPQTAAPPSPAEGTPVAAPPQTAAPAGEAEKVREAYSLPQLVGRSELTVSADSNGQFSRSAAQNSLFEGDRIEQAKQMSLPESIRAGRTFSRESLAAAARTDQARAQTGQALALLLPSVSVRVSSGIEISKPSVVIDENTGSPVPSDTHSRTDAALTVRQPLFDLPSYMDWRRRKMVEQARGENYRISDGDAYLSTAGAYLTLVSSRLQTDMTREFEAQLSDLSSYIEKRASAGAASVSDMARVRARRQAALSSRLEQESAHAAAGMEFVRLTNIVPHTVKLPQLDDLGARQLPETLEEAVASAMKSNPEVTALTAEIQAAHIDQTTAKGRFLPRVDAEYTDSFSLHAGGDTSSAGQRDQRIMMVLNWSLFSGGSDYNGHLERTSRHKELQYRLDDQRRRVTQTLSANYATLTTTRERIATGYQELKSISTAAEAMSKRMLSGNQSLLDLLDVYDRLYQVRSRLVSLHILEMSTAAQLVRLTYGTPGPGSSPAGSSSTAAPAAPAPGRDGAQTP